MNRRLLLILLTVSLFAASCDRNELYNESRHIDKQGWNMDDKLVFDLEANDTNSTYLCCIDIRNRNDYPYSNIYFFITTIYPDGSVAADTNIEFKLAERDGRWLGKESGRYVDGRYPFCYFHFPQQGNYQFIISHAMREKEKRGIKERHAPRHTHSVDQFRGLLGCACAVLHNALARMAGLYAVVRGA